MRPLTLASLAVLALAPTLSACGTKTTTVKRAETEGLYVNVGPLKYQVQISRALNPGAVAEDRTMLQGVSPAEARLGPNEVWFAVFLRVENESARPQRPAEVFELADQQGGVFEPVEIGPGNPFRYDRSPIPPNGYAPAPDTVARQLGSIGGMLQLFKVPRQALDNRPVELRIRSVVPADEATVQIDV